MRPCMWRARRTTSSVVASSLQLARRLASGERIDNTTPPAAQPPPNAGDALPPEAAASGASDASSPLSSSGAVLPTTDGNTPSDVAEHHEPQRWVQAPFKDMDVQPILDERGEYIVSNVKWPTGDVAYTTPPPPGHLAPRFGYNILQVKKDVSWWQHYHKYPRLSLAYLNIQFFFLIGAAWLVAFLMTEYRNMTDEMRTPGALVGDHRGRGPVTKGTQKVSFTQEEMTALIGGAQENWMDAKGEKSYVGTKEYRMKQIARPKEFSVDDFRKR